MGNPGERQTAAGPWRIIFVGNNWPPDSGEVTAGVGTEGAPGPRDVSTPEHPGEAKGRVSPPTPRQLLRGTASTGQQLPQIHLPFPPLIPSPDHTLTAGPVVASPAELLMLNHNLASLSASCVSSQHPRYVLTSPPQSVL